MPLAAMPSAIICPPSPSSTQNMWVISLKMNGGEATFASAAPEFGTRFRFVNKDAPRREKPPRRGAERSMGRPAGGAGPPLPA